jgi:hypothetical protein
MERTNLDMVRRAMVKEAVFLTGWVKEVGTLTGRESDREGGALSWKHHVAVV